MTTEFEKEKIFWTHNMNLKLVKFIERKPFIWNSKHPKYTAVELRDNTYANFAKKYGDNFSGRAVKQRWTNIRSTFAYYLRKLRAADAAGETFSVQWHLWEACQFLCRFNKNTGNDRESYKKEVTDSDDALDNIVSQELTRSSDDSSDNEPNEPQNESQIKCKEISTQLLNVFKNVQNDVFGLESSKHSRLGRAIAKKLSEISPLEAARACHRITEILLLYEDGNPNNPNYLPKENLNDFHSNR